LILEFAHSEVEVQVQVIRPRIQESVLVGSKAQAIPPLIQESALVGMAVQAIQLLRLESALHSGNTQSQAEENMTVTSWYLLG
jgi:hypothetical protein